MQVTFESHEAQQRLCFDIAITNDMILENDESFLVSLSSPGLNFSPDTTVVTITNSNCKNRRKLCKCHSCYIFAVVTVRFELQSYVFLESIMAAASVCVLSTGASAIPFTVTVLTLDSGSALGITHLHPTNHAPTDFHDFLQCASSAQHLVSFVCLHCRII